MARATTPRRRSKRVGTAAPTGASIVDALIEQSVQRQVTAAIAAAPRWEQEYLRVHAKWRFPDKDDPPAPPFHARVSARARAAKVALAEAARMVRPRRLAKRGVAPGCRVDVVGERSFAFEPTIGGHLEAARVVFILEDIAGVTVRYVRGRRP